MRASSIANKAYDLTTNLITSWMHLHPIQTRRITDHLYAVRTGTVNLFLYQENENLICIDSGFGKSIVLREMNKIGIHPADVKYLFLTHSDFDHADGSSVFTEAEIYLSHAEEQLITGRKARMGAYIYNSKIDRPYHLLQDNEIVFVGSTKVQAISTPGHTTGSMSYLVNESLLFVGDAFKLVQDKVIPKRRYINMDTEKHKASIRKLARLQQVRLAFTAHNGYTEEFDHAISCWR